MKHNWTDWSAEGIDYNRASGTLAFDEIQTRRCVPITIIDDSVNEQTECFNFNLVAGVTNIQPVTQVCIIDNDGVTTNSERVYLLRTSLSISHTHCTLHIWSIILLYIVYNIGNGLLYIVSTVCKCAFVWGKTLNKNIEDNQWHHFH